MRILRVPLPPTITSTFIFIGAPNAVNCSPIWNASSLYIIYNNKKKYYNNELTVENKGNRGRAYIQHPHRPM